MTVEHADHKYSVHDNGRSSDMTVRPRGQPAEMSEQSSSQVSGGSSPKKRGVLKATVDIWIIENDKALCTSTWLNYEVDRGRVVALKCAVCCQIREDLIGM